MNTSCPCGSKQDYQQCCGSIIEGQRPAVTAEELMRSRYSAFTLANVDYLMRSHYSKTRPVRDRKKILQWAKSVKWIGLTILDTHWGQANDLKGTVEFRAVYLEDGKMAEIHENSLFEREKGCWVYVSGDFIK